MDRQADESPPPRRIGHNGNDHGNAFRPGPDLVGIPMAAMTYHALIVVSTFVFIGIAMLATLWEMWR